MKTFERVLFIIALLILTSQIIHIAYKLWIKSSTSVLDKYDDNLKSEIEKANSLEELVKKYEIAHTEVMDYKKNNPDEEENSFGIPNIDKSTDSKGDPTMVIQKTVNAPSTKGDISFLLY